MSHGTVSLVLSNTVSYPTLAVYQFTSCKDFKKAKPELTTKKAARAAKKSSLNPTTWCVI